MSKDDVGEVGMLLKNLVGQGETLRDGDYWLEFQLEDSILFSSREFSSKEFGFEFHSFSGDLSEATFRSAGGYNLRLRCR